MTGWIEGVVRDGGYLLLGALVLLENVFPPIPSEVVLPLAGFQVFRGSMDFVPAVIAATAGSLLGALALYFIGRVGGRPLLLKHGRLLRLDAKRLERADRWFDRYGAAIVLVGRLVPGLRSVVSVPAGLSEMPVPLFVLLTTLGSALWNSALIGAGLALGPRWKEATALVERFDVYLVAGAGVIFVGWLLLRWHRRRRQRSEKSEAASDGSASDPAPAPGRHTD